MFQKPFIIFLTVLIVSLVFAISGCGDDDDNSTGPSNTTDTTVTDIDGNVYKTVRIGDQLWMAGNLKVTHYRNGDPIPQVTDASGWKDLSSGACCCYDNDPDLVADYGRLYNWHAVIDARRIAPEGWHVATDLDWKELEMELGMTQGEADDYGWRGGYEGVGGKLKDTGTAFWSSPNTSASNLSGFSALPGGYRTSDIGYFMFMGDVARFWTATENPPAHAWTRALKYDRSHIDRTGWYKECGFSVRCVRN